MPLRKEITINGLTVNSNQGDAVIRYCKCTVAPGEIGQFTPTDGLAELELNNDESKKVFFTTVKGRNGTVTLHETDADDTIETTETAILTLKVGLANDLYPNPKSWLNISNDKYVTFQASADNPTSMTIEGYVIQDGA